MLPTCGDVDGTGMDYMCSANQQVAPAAVGSTALGVAGCCACLPGFVEHRKGRAQLPGDPCKNKAQWTAKTLLDTHNACTKHFGPHPLASSGFRELG